MIEMSKPSNTARAIQLDKQAFDLEMQALRIAETASNPNTCAETHVTRIAERFQAQSEFLKSIANHFGKKSMTED
jgi:hypothetical protein